MKIEAEQVLCRFQLSNVIRHGMSPLYEWIVETAHRQGLQGATVFKGFFGLRPQGSILEEHAWSLSQELPVIVEVVDEPARIEALLANVEPVFREGVITLERAHVLIYRAGSRRAPAAPLAGRNIIATTTTSAAFGVRTMKKPEDGVLLRIFIGESDREPGGDRPLYEGIVRRVREAHLAGATVLRGPMGFGRHSRVHTAKLLELSTDLPIVIEIVDSEENVDAFLPTVDELVSEGLVTLEAVRIVRYVSPDTGSSGTRQAGS
jgi:PII-like signaling protein